MQKIGLVLDGGGGRGSYHIGVWKYLKEVGLDNNIKGIAGTSVGGLNACLFALNNYELSETIWTQKIEDKILDLSVEPKDAKDIITQIVNILIIPFNAAIGVFNFLKTVVSKGIFSRKGLSDLIDEYIDLDAISKMYFPIYVTCTEFSAEIPFLHTRYLKLNGQDRDTIKKMLLSTSAIPVIFPKEAIYMDGRTKKYYWDGGLKDNSPIKPLCDEGCSDIIVIHLDPIEIIKDRPNNVNIYEICPSKDLGNMITGVLDFSAEGAFKRINQGYEDARRILQPVVDIARSGAAAIYNLNIMAKENSKFNNDMKDIERIKYNNNQLMNKINNFEDYKRYLEDQDDY